MLLEPPPKRILAVKLADLGDLLSVTPALQALRAAYPSSRIDLLVPPQSASLLQGASYIDRILQFDKFPFDRKRGLLDVQRLWQTARFLVELRMSGYDWLVLFHHLATRWGTFKFAAVSLATGAKLRAGLDNGRGGFLTVRLPDEGFGAMHEVDYWLALVGLLGADASGGWRPHIPIDEKSRARVTTLLDEMGINRARPLVAIHPGAGWYSRARIWPVERFAAVARGLATSHGATVLVLGGPDEAPIAARLVELAGDSGRVVNVVGRTSIVETAALIDRCDLFVGNDSGPMHIAAAVGTPVVAVFGPSNIRAWGPYTPPGEENPHRVVARDLPCMPCFYRGHSVGLKEGCGTRECLTLLRSGHVLEVCRERLDGPGTKDQGPKAREVYVRAT
jgi:heptosyltransferase-2